MGNSNAQIVETFHIYRSTVPRIYREYLIEGIVFTVDVLNDRDQRRLARIVCGNKQATLFIITSTFNA